MAEKVYKIYTCCHYDFLLLLRDVIPHMVFIGSLQISYISSNILFKFNGGL